MRVESLLLDPRLWRGQNMPTCMDAPVSREAGRRERPLSNRPTGFAALDAALPGGGWPEAALVEILIAADGLGELSLLLPTLASLSSQDKPVLVIAPPYRPYAPAWQRAGVRLSQLHLIEANSKDALWAMEQALRAGCCGAVLGWPMHADDNALRRLQVAAESGQTLGFVFRPINAQSNPSPAPLRLTMRDDATHGPELRVLKCRGALPPAQAIPFRPYSRH